jgi:signal transduction histidine kinase
VRRVTAPPLLLALALALASLAAAQEPAAILIVDAGEPDQAEREAFQDGLQGALANASQAPSPPTVYTFNLELSRPGSAAPASALDARVRERYQGIRMAVIVALTDPAVSAALRWRDALWPGVPVVCLPSADAGDAPPLAAPQATTIEVRADPAATLRAALALVPGTSNLAIMGGSEVRGRMASTLQATAQELDPRLNLIELVGLPMPELKRQVAALPPQTIILSAGITQDGRGRRWVSADAHDYVAPSASAPIFAIDGSLIGHGVVGGVVLDYAAVGREAGDRVLRLLAGESVLSMPPVRSRSLRARFDHRELARWGIADAALPKGSQIVFRPQSFWEEHKGKVVAVGVALLLQSLAITSLLFERRRRRSAEARLRHLSGRLITAQEEERSRIARDLHDDASQRLALLAIELDQLQAQSLADSARSLSADLHQMAHQLHPAILDQLGLLPAARRFAAELAARHGVTVEVSSEGWPESLPRDIALVLYRVMQEALQNAVKHSGAARIEVAFRADGPELTLRVADQGRGFAPEQIEGASGIGLAGMSERLRLVGGGLRIQSAPQGGTIAEAWLPAPGAAAGASRGATSLSPA